MAIVLDANPRHQLALCIPQPHDKDVRAFPPTIDGELSKHSADLRAKDLIACVNQNLLLLPILRHAVGYACLQMSLKSHSRGKLRRAKGCNPWRSPRLLGLAGSLQYEGYS